MRRSRWTCSIHSINSSISFLLSNPSFFFGLTRSKSWSDNPQCLVTLGITRPLVPTLWHLHKIRQAPVEKRTTVQGVPPPLAIRRINTPSVQGGRTDQVDMARSTTSRWCRTCRTAACFQGGLGGLRPPATSLNTIKTSWNCFLLPHITNPTWREHSWAQRMHCLRWWGSALVSFCVGELMWLSQVAWAIKRLFDSNSFCGKSPELLRGGLIQTRYVGDSLLFAVHIWICSKWIFQICFNTIWDF